MVYPWITALHPIPQTLVSAGQQQLPPWRGAYISNFEDEYVLYWNQIWYKLPVRWDPKTNTGRFQSVSGSYQYRIFVAAIEAGLQYQ